jgi:hypothetical protein
MKRVLFLCSSTRAADEIGAWIKTLSEELVAHG